MDDLGQLFSAHGEVDELELAEEFQNHLVERGTYQKHRVTIVEVLQAHANQPRYFTNASPGHRAVIIMVGPTRTGRLLCVPLEPTGRAGIWRPVTAFEANAHHRDKYRGG